MKFTHTSMAWAVSLLAAFWPLADAAGPAPNAMGCLIEPERTTDVGSPVIGVIERMEVDRGQTVRRGQVLAVLRANVERATLSVASSRADSDAEYKAAAASASFNHERLTRAEDLFRQQFISQQALDQTRTEAQLADHKLAQAREQREVSQQERGVAAAQLSQRVIRSPMDGVVAERYLSAGERVDDKPLLRIARVDPLRVQLVVPISMYGQVQQSGQASVVPELPGATAKMARVTMIDKVVDPASNTFRVQLELPNADYSLPAGLRCKAEFAAAQAPASAAPAPTLPTRPPAAVPVTAPAAAVTPPRPVATPTSTPSARATAVAQAGLKLTPMLFADAGMPPATATAAPGPELDSAVVVTGHVRRVAMRPKPTRTPAPAPAAVPEAPTAAGPTQTALVAEPVAP